MFFLHIGGRDDGARTLAAGVKAMWDAIKAVREKNPRPAARSPGELPKITGQYPVQALQEILGAEGKLNGQVLKFTFGRSATMHGAPLTAAMGLSTWAAFSGEPTELARGIRRALDTQQ